MLFPFIPQSAAKLWSTLNLGDRRMGWDSAADFSMPAGHVIKKPEILFGKVEMK
jgi:methionyl-tRNA synthetase